MSYNPDEELTITYRTLGKASGDAYKLGHTEGQLDAYDTVLDLLAEQQCSHAGCAKCEAYDFIATRIAAKQTAVNAT